MTIDEWRKAAGLTSARVAEYLEIARRNDARPLVLPRIDVFAPADPPDAWAAALRRDRESGEALRARLDGAKLGLDRHSGTV